MGAGQQISVAVGGRRAGSLPSTSQCIHCVVAWGRVVKHSQWFALEVFQFPARLMPPTSSCHAWRGSADDKAASGWRQRHHSPVVLWPALDASTRAQDSRALRRISAEPLVCGDERASCIDGKSARRQRISLAPPAQEPGRRRGARRTNAGARQTGRFGD